MAVLWCKNAHINAHICPKRPQTVYTAVKLNTHQLVAVIELSFLRSLVLRSLVLTFCMKQVVL